MKSLYVTRIDDKSFIAFKKKERFVLTTKNFRVDSKKNLKATLDLESLAIIKISQEDSPFVSLTTSCHKKIANQDS
jgi:hypothetical protein